MNKHVVAMQKPTMLKRENGKFIKSTASPLGTGFGPQFS